MKAKKIIVGLLVLGVVFSSFSVAGTYAKYTSNSDVSDTARIAKWNIGTANKINLFSPAYIKPASGTTPAITLAKSSDNSNIIAPGLTGEGTYAITGTENTEVAYKLSFSNIELNIGITGSISDISSNVFRGGDQIKEYLNGVLKFMIIDETDSAHPNYILADYDNKTGTYSYKNLPVEISTSNTIQPGSTTNPKITIKWIWEDAEANNAKDNEIAKIADQINVTLSMKVTAEQYTGA